MYGVKACTGGSNPPLSASLLKDGTEAAPSPVPRPSGAGPAILGCFATAGVHFVVLMFLMWAGSVVARDAAGAVIGILFLYVVGLVQWIYLWPLISLSKRSGHPGIAKGLRFGGLAVLGLNVLGWAAFGIVYLNEKSKGQQLERSNRDHPYVVRDVVGTLVAADPKHVEVDTPQGRVWVGLQDSTHYVQLDGPYGHRARTRDDIVKVGVAVEIHAGSYDGGPLYASYVSRKLGENAPSPAP